jgi:DNA-binding transcriptional LysR family regulator
MELRHLRYFVGVAHHLNYSEASRRLHVAQPAISQTILDLEEELGVKLLLRTKRTVQLTRAGSAFLHEAEQILTRAARRKRGDGQFGHRIFWLCLESVLAFPCAIVSPEISCRPTTAV